MSDTRTPLANEREAAAHTRLSQGTLRQMRYRGTGPKFVKAGRAVRYRWSDLDAWIEAQTVDPGAGAA